MEMFERLQTVLVLLRPGPVADLVDSAIRDQKLKTWKVQRTTDLVAVGCLLAIIDPDLIKKNDWEELCGWYKEMDDPEMKVLLVTPPKHLTSLPSRNLITPPRKIDKTFLRVLLVHQRSLLERRKNQSDKKLRQITRLMFMLSILDRGKVLKVRDVAKVLEVTPRTVQRDLETLLAAGYPVDFADQPGNYKFPDGFKSYDLFYED